MSNIIVGLDIGTSFVRTVIGEIVDDGSIEIVGVARKPSSGLRNGVIVNLETTEKCIREVIEEAEQRAGYEVVTCFTGIGGMQIESMDSTGIVAVAQRGRSSREISQSDIKRVHEAANAVQIPMDRQMLHLIPQEYIVDGIGGYKDPLNMLAVRLESKVHIITASKTAIQNITACVERARYSLGGVMLKTLACSEAVMNQDEKNLGSILIDLGGGTTDVLVVVDDAPVCTCSIPVGGNLVTNDIAIVKGISTEVAERIKIENGCCWLEMLDHDEEVIIPGVGGRGPEAISRAELCQIIEPRMEEIFTMVRDEIIHKTNLTQLSGNIILTGGGAQMLGAVELAQTVFGTSAVKVGICGNLGGIEE
ncbi:MAG: cell division protein FtsA, partial [Treponema sp.]|nr:cell division protein FtsA [Treponema sp.]